MAAAESTKSENAIGKILIVGSAWVGDMIMSQSLFMLLKARHPDCVIDVLAPPWTLPLLEFMPEIRRGIVLPFRHGELNIARRRQIGLNLAEEGYDVSVTVPRTLKAAAVSYWAGIPRRYGNPRQLTLGMLTDRRVVDPRDAYHQADRFVSLVLEPGEPIPDYPPPRLTVDGDRIAATLSRNGLSRPERPLLILAPGSGNNPAKRWPVRYFADLARARLESGWDVWLFGSDDDRELTETVHELAGRRTVDLGGKTPLSDAVALTALADRVLANDSGMMHVAAALDRPTIGIFGPTDPYFTAPRSPLLRSIRLPLACSPCGKSACPLGHFQCMWDLSPAVVLDALDGLPADDGGAQPVAAAGLA